MKIPPHPPSLLRSDHPRSARRTARRPGRAAALLAAILGALAATPATTAAPATAAAATAAPAPATAAGTTGPTAPTAPPAAVCGDAAILDGPASPPPGSVRIDPGDDLDAATQAHPPGTTFWLSPGIHQLAPDPAAHVNPKDANTYVGAPGAVLDGQRINRMAFGGHNFAVDVTIRHLTVRGFGPVGGSHNEGVVNHEHGAGWTVERSTVRDNAGAGVLVGSRGTVRLSCLAGNGQYGANVFMAEEVTFERNEVTANNADGWEVRIPGCGCAGGAKFWDSTDVVVTDNWVHGNDGPGLWIDTNNAGFRIEGNLIADNTAEALIYELSYNARIAGNTLARNGLVKGRDFADKGITFPIAAVYVSESGGDARAGGAYSTLEITGNVLDGNWGGIILWENANRFCGSPANSSATYCTRGGAATLDTCVAGTILDPPYFSDCRWKTQNVVVHHNELRIDKKALGCAAGPCGMVGMFSNVGSTPAWTPYTSDIVQRAVTFEQGNRFSDNTYVGDWRFIAFESSRVLDFPGWRSPPYLQDGGANFDPGPVDQAANALDPDSSGFEGSLGSWAPWFSAAVSRPAGVARAGAHSMRVEVTAGHGWGVVLTGPPGSPGVPAAPGPRTVSFWARTGAGTAAEADLGATLRVRWRDAGGAQLAISEVSVAPLGPAWALGTLTATAPPGTAYVAVELSHPSGGPGTVLHFDDIAIVPSPYPEVPAEAWAGHLDPDTSTLERTIGAWSPWFSATVERASGAARTGAYGLRVGVKAAHGWGVTQDNWPGFPAAPGTRLIAFWGRAPAGAGLVATMTVRWRDAAGAELAVDTVTLPLSDEWARAAADVTAPPGTVRVGVEFSHRSGSPGDEIHLDDIVVAPPLSLLDLPTSDLEASTGQWIPWFSTILARSPVAPHGGARSLEVAVTARFGWGVTQQNWPGFPAKPGTKAIGFWARSPSTGLSATMTVNWRDVAGRPIGSETLTLDLGPEWTEAGAIVVAPPGTARVGVDFSHRSGGPGDTLFLDDIVVRESAADPAPAPTGPVQALDRDTSTLEGSTGQWMPWFSAAVSRAADEAHGGGHSLRVEVTAPHGWGVALRNWPGFATTPGPKTAAFWGLGPPGGGLAVTMTLRWRDAAGTELASHELTLALTGTWAQAQAPVVAPPGTVVVGVELTHRSGGPGDTLHLDDLTVTDD